ncbi:Uncharacterised protein [Legionella busanensis]|uniref:Uncharacterized protein n=1 Tax=Legionella busanensis TaxID=190655 RepID=A0A378JL30_9GAMM|nr:hypothetical protein [Legionella busanensis]STX51777.1 Uncharacterised protein [Legionella busanensis]
MPSQTHYDRLATLLNRPKLSKNEIKVALTIVSQLGQADLEKKDKHERYLFDLAVEAQNAVIASAIISKYAELTKAEFVAREAELIEIEGAALAARLKKLTSSTNFDEKVREGTLLNRDRDNLEERKASFAKAHPNFNYTKHMKKFASKFKPLEEESYDNLLKRHRQLKSLKDLAPLSIDFDNNDPLMQRYHDTSSDNLPPIMSKNFFKFYCNDLIDRQKLDYILYIQEEINNLRIIGALKLIEVTKSPQLKASLLTAVSAYQRNPSDTLTKLKTTIDMIITEKQYNASAGAEALAVLIIVSEIEEKVANFWHGKRNVQHPKLAYFIEEAQSTIKRQTQFIQSRGIREILARLGNKLVSIVTESKLFDERNDAEKQIDKVHERVQSGLTFFSNQVTQEQAKKPAPKEFIEVSERTKRM